jgi:pimeloyl-ACP methyl ester carboxylesterase
MKPLLHRHEVVNGTTWHWAEVGEGDPVVLLHGIPESWQCWRHQMQILGRQFRVLSLDLPGYGQSDKQEGEYTGNNIARKVLELLDKLGIDRFRLAGHDWGVIVGDHVCDQAARRVERYVRCCLSLHRYDARNALHHQWNAMNPEAFGRLLRHPEAYVRVWFDSSCTPETKPSDAEIAEIVAEFSYPGVADAVPRYFRDIQKSTPVDYSRFTMPVLYVHGEHDPRQPVDYARGMEEHVPGLEAILVLDCGHFVTRERPEELAQAMMFFYHSMLAPGLRLFDRSRHHGLPTMPTRPLPQWGVNPARLDIAKSRSPKT